MHLLFDESQRTRMFPKRWAEPDITFLNQSADSIEDRVRTLMTDWCIEYPSRSRADLVGRFRSKDHGQHLGALNELFLHALFRRLNYTIDVMPAGPQNHTAPDFSLNSHDLPDFDLEITVAEVAEEERARRNRASVIYDSIDRIKTRNFMLFVESWSGPNLDLSSTWIRNTLSQWINQLDPCSIPREYDIDDLPRTEVDCGSWKVKFRAVPVDSDSHGIDDQRIIGAHSSGLDTPMKLDNEDRIRRALQDKTTKYGPRDRPFVIAVGFGRDGIPPSVRSLQRALFGSEQWLVQSGVGVVSALRERNGLFWGPEGPRNTRVSGVVLIRSIDAWSVATAELLYMENPWAVHPLLDLPPVFERWFVSSTKKQLIRSQAARSLARLFELPTSWPESVPTTD